MRKKEFIYGVMRPHNRGLGGGGKISAGLNLLHIAKNGVPKVVPAKGLLGNVNISTGNISTAVTLLNIAKHVAPRALPAVGIVGVVAVGVLGAGLAGYYIGKKQSNKKHYKL